MRTQRKPNGFVIYRGPSAIDGAPIVAIATGFARGSDNRKTGKMVQTWIIREDLSPTEALKAGKDASVCGDCPLRGVLGKKRGCYVNLGQGPLSVFRAFKRGSYPELLALPEVLEAGRGRTIRVGSYGDPAAVPVAVWDAFLKASVGHTGYTHQWKSPRLSDGLSRFLMASADSEHDKARAWALGWRTFRLAEAPGRGEIECPSSRGISCEDCQLCGGAGMARSITIPAHGVGKKYAAAVAAAA